MKYNPALCRWEGNENAMTEFDALVSPKSLRAAPALITHVGANSSVQVVNGMVFDPQRMCWLKTAPNKASFKDGLALATDEEDVFAGLDDLEDRPKGFSVHTKSRNSRPDTRTHDIHDNHTHLDDRSGDDSSDEFPITEEFDVGPEFIKRQRAEEEKWKRKVSKWITEDLRSENSWRWVIRDLVRPDLVPNAI